MAPLLRVSYNGYYTTYALVVTPSDSEGHPLWNHVFYYVYILQSQKDQQLYVGFTTDLKKRIQYHAAGKSTATKMRRPMKLMYAEAYSSQSDARSREKFLKSGRGHEVIKKQLRNTLAGVV